MIGVYIFSILLFRALNFAERMIVYATIPDLVLT